MPGKKGYPISSPPLATVTIDDTFWSPRITTNRRVTLPTNFEKCESTQRIANFDIAAGQIKGAHEGIFFNDSDVYKIIEGAAYHLNGDPDPALAIYLDDIIAKIAAAQEPDGYLYTARTIAERNGTPETLQAEREGLHRWSHLRVSHELYNVGHLYEAAVAHYKATGQRNLLDIALKNADLIDAVFGPDQKHDVPGHQEIELGLVKLYAVTDEERYLRLAKFFLDQRGRANGRPLQRNYDNEGYTQDHRPIVDQDEAVGHAVRALYMLSGMVDVAALTGDQAYQRAIDRLWANVVGRKLYLTGGVGARHHGEAFGDDYELPNDTAYAETCAAQANLFWNQRLFQLYGDARYIDVLERTLYNGFLAGIAFGGDRFFYTNPLAFDGHYRFNRDDSNTRRPWFHCSCCPSNVVRLFPALAGYLYAVGDNAIYLNLFASSTAELTIGATAVRLTQTSDYPWEGDVRLSVDLDAPAAFALKLRLPGWAQGRPVPSDLYRYRDATTTAVTLTLNEQAIDFNLSQGYVTIDRTWQPGDSVHMKLPMPVRRVLSHPAVAANAGRVALERGPLVYCLEEVDNGAGLAQKVLPDTVGLTAVFEPDLLNGVTVIRSPAAELTAIPYYAWAHRGLGEMAVWLQR